MRGVAVSACHCRVFGAGFRRTKVSVRDGRGPTKLMELIQEVKSTYTVVTPRVRELFTRKGVGCNPSSVVQ